MKKQFPTAKAVQFLLCEDVRKEEGGKLGIAGLFPAGQIVVHNGQVPSEVKGVAVIEAVCLVFLITKGHGEFDTHVRVDAPDSETVFNQRVGSLTMKPGTTGTFVAKLSPFLVKAFGQHRAVLTLDDHEYAMPFEIRPAEPIPTAQDKAA